jgi:hypothetical protein
MTQKACNFTYCKHLKCEEYIKDLTKGNTYFEIVLNLVQSNGIDCLDAFTKLRKTSIILILTVRFNSWIICTFVRNNSVTTGCNFVNFRGLLFQYQGTQHCLIKLATTSDTFCKDFFKFIIRIIGLFPEMEKFYRKKTCREN